MVGGLVSVSVADRQDLAPAVLSAFLGSKQVVDLVGFTIEFMR